MWGDEETSEWQVFSDINGKRTTMNKEPILLVTNAFRCKTTPYIRAGHIESHLCRANVVK